jgi:hypothetical protein
MATTLKSLSDKIAKLEKKISDLEKKNAARVEETDEKLFASDEEIVEFNKFVGKLKNFPHTIFGASFAARLSGKYKGNGIFLGDAFNGERCPWEIVIDDEECWVLIFENEI